METTGGSQWKLQRLIQSGLALAAPAELQEIVQSATDAALELTGAQFGAFFYNVVDEHGERYQLYTLAGADPEKFASFPMPRNTAIFATTFEGLGVVRSDNITADPRYGQSPPHYGMPHGHLPVRSYLAVPVKARSGEVLGGLFYGHEQTGRFNQEAEDLVGTVAAQAAIAIENHRLHEKLMNTIAELHQANHAQQQTERRLSHLAAIVEASDDAIVSIDLNRIIKSWNPAATRIFGYAPHEIIGSSILRLVPSELHSDEEAIFAQMRIGERIDHYETIRVAKSGACIPVSLSVSPLRDSSGQLIGASKIIRDISSRKIMETAFLESEKFAAVGRIASTIAHEINNPLEAVVNLLYLAKQESNTSKQAEYLDAAESEIGRVSHIAKQSLGYHRDNTLPQSCFIPDLITDVVRIYRSRCRDLHIVVKTELQSTRHIRARHGIIISILSNLIANAVHAMPDGGVLLLQCHDVDDGIRIRVSDTGKGIPASVLPKIFNAFFTTRQHVGTGIGLYITKKYIQEHHGSITVETSTAPESHGTAFTVFLPAHPSGAERE